MDPAQIDAIASRVIPAARSIRPAYSVRFIVVGGSAVRWHILERPIGSNDLDVLPTCKPENAAGTVSAIESSWMDRHSRADVISQNCRPRAAVAS